MIYNLVIYNLCHTLYNRARATGRAAIDRLGRSIRFGRLAGRARRRRMADPASRANGPTAAPRAFPHVDVILGRVHIVTPRGRDPQARPR